MRADILSFFRFVVCGLFAASFLSAHADESGEPRVLLETDAGPITLELFSEKAPQTVENFLTYVDDGFYDGTIFHRVIPGFVAQGGGLTYDFTAKETRDPVVNESDNGLKNLPMTVAMARTSDPDSGTSQFFINLNNNQSLNAREDQAGYTVFAKVVSGQETVIDIVEAPRGNYRAYPDAPNTPIRILTAKRLADTSESAQ